MIKNKEELLTHEVYNRQGVYYLSIPVNNLISPKFLIKNNNLYIFLYNYSQSYIVKNVANNVLEAIKNENCFLLENLDQENPVKHLIKLWQV